MLIATLIGFITIIVLLYCTYKDEKIKRKKRIDEYRKELVRLNLIIEDIYKKIDILNYRYNYTEANKHTLNQNDKNTKELLLCFYQSYLSEMAVLLNNLKIYENRKEYVKNRINEV